MDDRNAPPLNPLPPIVWILVLPLIAMEVVLSLGTSGYVGGPLAIGWRAEAIQRFAFAPDMLRQMIETGRYPLDGLRRLVSYPLVHANFTHAMFVVVIVLALGKMVGEIFRWTAVVAVVLVATVAGALVMTAVPTVHSALIGGYPPAYGLIGAFTFILWVRLAGTGSKQYRAFLMIGFLMAIQVLFAVAFGGGYSWVADLGGFVAGFVLSFVVSPGGWSRMLARFRQRG